MSKVTITLEQLCVLGACDEGVKAFLEVYSNGVAEIDLTSHEDAARVLSGPLAEFAGWAFSYGLFGGFRLAAGNHGTATAGYGGTATAGEYGTATAGNHGTATAGHHGTATAGYYGTAKAGHHGTATSGVGGTATAGYGGTATAGVGGEIRIRWHDGARYRLAVGYVGEDGIKPDTPYRVVNGRLMEVES